MTVAEFEQKLNSLNEEQFRQFAGDFGGGGSTRAWYVNHYVDHPKHEARLCRILNIETEAERDSRRAEQATEAAIESATAAKDANQHSAEANCVAAKAAQSAAQSNRIAYLALAVAACALIWEVLRTLLY